MILTRPARLETLVRMAELLADTINGTDGYAFDIERRVYRGRLFFGDETPLPCLSILEAPIPLDQIPSAKDNEVLAGPWELVIQGWVKDDRENPTDPAHVLMADVKRCLATERARGTHWREPEDGLFGLGRVVTALYIGPGVVRPPEEISSRAYFWLTITLDMAEDMTKPYEA